jgi:predicted aspartyl protease
MKAPVRTLVLLLSATLSCGAAHAACTYVRQMALPVHYLPGSALPLVDGSINGKPAAMSVNTGAYTTALLAAQAERRGISLRTRYEPAFDGRAQLQTMMALLAGDPVGVDEVKPELRATTDSIVGTGENVATYLATIKEFAVGPARAPQGRLPVIDSRASAPYDAVVGADFLLQSDLELALDENQVRFFRGAGCTDSFLAYWDENAVVVPMEKTGVPQAVVAVGLNGKSVLAMIDTGTVRSYVTPALAASLGVRTPPAQGPSAASAGTEEEIDAWPAQFETLSIGAATFQSPFLYVSRNEMARPVPYQIVLGLDFLKAHRLLLANSQRKVYFSVKASSRAFTQPRPTVNVEQIGKPTSR